MKTPITEMFEIEFPIFLHMGMTLDLQKKMYNFIISYVEELVEKQIYLQFISKLIKNLSKQFSEHTIDRDRFQLMERSSQIMLLRIL